MPVNKKILDINMDNIKFSHGIMHGSISIDLEKKTLLLGENGAGKTSFVEFLKNEQVSLFKESVFFISQDELLRHEVLSSLDLLEVLKKSVKERVIETNFFKFINTFELGDEFLNKATSKLSGGERQLIKLALGFSIDAQYLIIDEPFNNLSKEKRKRVRSFINSEIQGALIIDHFHDEWIEQFDERFMIYSDADDLFIKRVEP